MSPNLSHIASLPGPWIALAADGQTVLARGKTADEVWKKARRKRPATVIVTDLSAEDDEIPNDDLIAAIREGEEEERSGKLEYYSTVEEFMASLE